EDSMVLGWDFLSEFGTTVTCAGHRVVIPKRGRWGGCLEDRLSVTVAGCPEVCEDERNKRFIKRELEAFAGQRECSNITQHRITMKDDTPIKQQYYPKNPKIQGEINAKVEELLEKGRIEPSNSAYSSPIVMVKKKSS
ncbi:hypothetical protein KR026_009880, partial [Drosophila bipectinata]